MTLKQGDRLPEAMFGVMTASGPELKSTADIFSGRRVALFGLPGAYTPVCHRQHLPGIISLQPTLASHGIDTVACTAVNDVFVLDRWAKEVGARGKVVMLADGNGDFAVQSGLAVDLREFGFGVRSNRYAMLVSDGAVKLISIEDVLTSHEKSSASTLCSMMEAVA